jgi:cellulose synthase/poly-beta-1,6-N-acetylglucosamine synthase-like glycosyltransferase
MTGTLLEITVLLCLGYLLLTNVTYVALVVVAFVENVVRRHEHASQDFDVLGESRFTIPVSVIVAAYNEESAIVSTVESLLGLEYPEFEVIAVNDGSGDGTLERLVDAFELEPYHVFVRHVFPTEDVRAIYRSTVHPNLVVVDKENGGKSDALNAGVNVARYRYICSTDADTVFEKESMLRIIRPVVRDPKRVVAVGGQVRVGNGFRVAAGRIVERRLPSTLLPRFQIVEYLRTFLSNRVGWSAINSMLLISGAFGLWRRDTLVSIGGFNRNITGEDLELTLRIHRVLRKRGEDYKVLSMPDPVCWTEAPDDLRSFYEQRNRWHRVLLESFSLHREMLLNPFYKTPGMVGMPYYFFFEILGPFFEVFSYFVVGVGYALGVVSPETLFLFLLLSVGYTTLLNSAAILIEDVNYQSYSLGDVMKLVGVGFLDNLGYRQLTMVIRVVATFDWFSRTRRWGVITRRGYGGERPA